MALIDQILTFEIWHWTFLNVNIWHWLFWKVDIGFIIQTLTLGFFFKFWHLHWNFDIAILEILTFDTKGFDFFLFDSGPLYEGPTNLIVIFYQMLWHDVTFEMLWHCVI